MDLIPRRFRYETFQETTDPERFSARHVLLVPCRKPGRPPATGRCVARRLAGGVLAPPAPGSVGLGPGRARSRSPRGSVDLGGAGGGTYPGGLGYEQPESAVGRAAAHGAGIAANSAARFVAESPRPQGQPAVAESFLSSQSLPGSESAGLDTDLFDQLLANDFDSLAAPPSPRPVLRLQAGGGTPSRADPAHSVPVVAPDGLSRPTSQPAASPA